MSEQQQTNPMPKGQKHMDPDLTVVVGDVEFHHNSVILSKSCPYFAKMLSSKMKEANEGRVEFPDKNPQEWQEVYKFLEHFSNPNPLMEPVAALITAENALWLASWFEYLGLDESLNVCDRVMEKHYYRYIVDELGFSVRHSSNPSPPKPNNKPIPSYFTGWLPVKLLSMPRTQRLLLARTKHLLPRVEYPSQKSAIDMFSFLLDDQCGEELWEHLVSEVNFPEQMLRNHDREAIVTNPLFQYILEMAAKDLLENAFKDPYADGEAFLRKYRPRA